MLVLPVSVVRTRVGLLAFLLFPVALGLLVAEPTWALLPVVLSWLTGQPWSRQVRRRRRGSGDPRLLTLWSTAFAASVVAAVAVRPWVLLVVVAMGALLLGERALDRRGLGNPTTGAAVFVAAGSGVVGVMDAVAEPARWLPPLMGWQTWLLIGICAVTLSSLLLHAAAVRHPLASRWTRADQVVALAGATGLCLVAAAGVTRGEPALVLLLPAALLLVERTYAPAARSLVERFGARVFRATELACLAVVVASTGLALHL